MKAASDAGKSCFPWSYRLGCSCLVAHFNGMKEEPFFDEDQFLKKRRFGDKKAR
jgi:hypothetical protein